MVASDIIILGIESSCDDTSAAVIKNGELLSNVTYTQDVHQAWGGVIPELASRAHEARIIPVVDAAINNAKITKQSISAIAFTRGPGLPGSLMVGVSFAKAMALSLNLPLIDVHHMQAHILAHFIKTPGQEFNPPQFPFLCLTVSGGHTQIVKINSYFDFEVIGETIDDAAGEAFDKTAKLLGLPYPGGPLIDKYAKMGDPTKFSFAKPQIKDYDFSFSGFKTSVLYSLQKWQAENPNFVEENLADLCASIQKTIVDVLIDKMKKAVKEYKVQDIALAGGVSANSGLRHAFEKLGKDLKVNTHIPPFSYCTDNAAMIAITGYHKYLAKDFTGQDISAMARWEM
ncbi:MAG TPA: tRNA (adenosine(37)-N6)-threonylcarbamoyltransferase complex transferase subunit TsaD [Bacteroidia bacterium]